MHRGFTTIFILVGILALAGLVGGAFYLGGNLKKSPVPIACTMEAKICPDGTGVGRVGPKCEFAPCPSSSSATPDETANWKIFTNTELEYSLKYPPQLKGSLDEYNSFNLTPSYGEPSLSGGVDHLNSGISIYEIDKDYNPKGLPIEEIAKNIQGNNIQRSVEKISMNSWKGLKVTHIQDNEIMTVSAYINHNLKIYLIDLEQNCSFPEVCIDIETFHKVLSTFKFTN